MSSRKADTEGIDEALLLDSIGRRKQDGSVQPQETKDASMPKAAETQSVSTAESTKEGGRRKRQNVDYTATFHQTQRDQNTPMRLYQPGNT